MTTAKKNTFGLQLPDFEDLQREVLMTYAVTIDPSRSMSREEQRIAAEASKQLQIIKYESAKVAAMQEEMGKLHKNASNNFETVVKHHFALQEQAQGKDYQPLLEKFHEYNLNSLAQHQQKAIEVGFYNIMQTASTSVKPAPEPEVVTVAPRRRPRGLLERLMGDDDGR